MSEYKNRKMYIVKFIEVEYEELYNDLIFMSFLMMLELTPIPHAQGCSCIKDKFTPQCCRIF